MAYASYIGDSASLADYSAHDDGQHLNDFELQSSSNDALLDKKTIEELADTLLQGRFFLTALELHAELQESGFELPKLRQFFSNPANVDQKAKLEHSLCRSPSQQTFDSIEFDRMSDVNNTEQDRVAVLEYELRKAKDTIKRLRENVTVQNAVTESMEPPPIAISLTKNEVEDDTLAASRPIDVLERRAINFLVHEFVLKNGCKMTAVTFSEENTDQDFDDWDDVGLNTPRPPSMLQLYRRFLHYHTAATLQNMPVATQDTGTNTPVDVDGDQTEAENAEKSKCESLQRKVEELEECLRKGKHDTEREMSRLMFENERLNEEVKRLKKTAALALTGGTGGQLRPDISTYSVASTTGALDDADAQTLQQEEQAPCLKVKADPCQLFPPNLVSRILNLIDNRLRSVSYTGSQDTTSSSLAGSNLVQDELEKLRSSFSPYDCTLSWEFYASVKKFIPPDRLENVVPFLVWLMLRTSGDQREEITQELLSLFGPRCDLGHINLIVSALLCYADLANIQEVQSHLLAVCWEQINDRDASKRLTVAYLCGPLACYLEPQIRSSLLFSILSQLLEEDKDSTVRLAALDSLVHVLLYLDDLEKLSQLTELYFSLVAKDSNENIMQRSQTVFLPTLLLWSSQDVTRFLNLVQSVVRQVKSNLTDVPVSSSKPLFQALTGLYNILPVIIYRCLASLPSQTAVTKDSWHADLVKLPRTGNDIFEWSVLETDHNKMKKQLEKLDAHVFECTERAKSVDGADNTVSFLSIHLSQPLLTICQELMPLIVQLASTISYSAKLELDIVLRINCFLAETLGPTVATALQVPLFVKHVLSIDEKLSSALVQSNSLAQTGFVAVYCGLLGCCPSPLRDEISPLLLDCVVALSTSNSEMAPLFTAFSLLAPSPQLPVLLSVVWDCVVHPVPAVRSSAAQLAEHLISLVDTTVLSSRLFSALVTLSNDPQISVRLATLGPLVALLTQTENQQLLEKVYFQLQQVLDDPQCADSPTAHIRAIELFTQIIPNVDTKFRDEFILQRFAVIAAQNNHCQDRSSRQSIAEALLSAYNTVNCCYIPESTIRRLVMPALKCLAVDLQTMGLKAEEEELHSLIKESEAKLSAASGPTGFSLPVISGLASSATKDRTSSIGSVSITSAASANNPPAFGQATPSAAIGTIMTSGSAAVAAAEAAKSKLAKFRQQSKTFFNK